MTPGDVFTAKSTWQIPIKDKRIVICYFLLTMYQSGVGNDYKVHNLENLHNCESV